METPRFRVMGSWGSGPGTSPMQVVRGQRPALCGAGAARPGKASGLCSPQAASPLLMTSSYWAGGQGLGRGWDLSSVETLFIGYLPRIRYGPGHFSRMIFYPHLADGEIEGQRVNMACPRLPLSWPRGRGSHGRPVCRLLDQGLLSTKGARHESCLQNPV